MPRWIKRSPSEKNYEPSRFLDLWRDLEDEAAKKDEQTDTTTPVPSMP